MHKVIYCLVFGRSKEKALDDARDILSRLCEDGELYDYFTTFDEDDPSSGKNRWGNLPVVAKASNKEGQKMINDGVKATKDEFLRAMRIIRKGLKIFSDEELFTDELSTKNAVRKKLCPPEDIEEKNAFDPEWVRVHIEWVNNHLNTFLYDQDGEKILTTKHLNGVLAKWSDEKYEDLEVFVVPADVHY